MKLKSLRSFGGDVFFSGLAKVFVAKPMIPGGFSIEKNVIRDIQAEEEESME